MEVIQSACMPRSGPGGLFQVFVGAIFCVLLALPDGARADAASEARAAFERGVAATRDARWQDARREFELSRQLVVKPSTLFNLALVDVKLGLAQEAIRELDAFEALAGEPHAEMVERARTLRAEAERLMDASKPALERARSLLEPGTMSSDELRLFQQGHDAYAEGDDRLALDSFERAYRLNPSPELLYDIGVVADRMRDDGRAIAAFRRFVSAMPDASEAALARRRIERLEQGMQPRRPAVIVGDESHAALAPEPASSQLSLRLPRALLSAGVVLAAGALGSTFWWMDRIDKFDGCHRPDEVCSNEAQVERQKRGAMVATGSLAISGLALVTGGGLLLAKKKRKANVDLQVSRERFALQLRAAF